MDQQLTYPVFTFPQQPTVPYTVVHEFTCTPGGQSKCPHGNFLKGVKWSPDGCCLLTASDDGWLRVFDLPQDAGTVPAPLLLPPPTFQPTHAPSGYIHPASVAGLSNPQGAETATGGAASSLQPGTDSCSVQGALPGVSENPQGSGGSSWVAPWSREQCDSLGVGLRVQEGETIYDFCWFSQMTATDPLSCCFASSSRAHPVHLWDACTGELRATYRGYNEVDEVAAAYSLAFTPDGSQLYAGYDKQILVFDVTRPGRDYGTVRCSGGARKGEPKLPGIISCMGFPPDGSTLAAGTYAGYVGTFDPRSPPHAQLQLLLHGHKGGLTQVSHTQDGQYLVTGARQDSSLLVWDLRLADEALYKLERDTKCTNQRIGFSIEPCGRHLLTGGCNGAVRVFDLQTGCHVDELLVAEGDTVNGCEAHPFLSLLAVSTGHRRFPLPVDDLADSDSNDSSDSEHEPRAQVFNQASGNVQQQCHQNQDQHLQHLLLQGPGTEQPPGVDVDPAFLVPQQAQAEAKRQWLHHKQRQRWSLAEHGSITNALRVLRLSHEMVSCPLVPPTVEV